MPIYAYKCAECGHEMEAIQKMSDALLTACPSCGKPTLVKQVTAAGFHLKGSGWYVTDFRDGGSKKKDAGKAEEKAKTETSEGSADAKTDIKGDAKPDPKAGGAPASDSQSAPKTETKTESKAETKPASGSKPAVAPAPPAPRDSSKAGGTSGGTG